MSKKEFVEAYAKATGETKKRAEELVNEFLGTVEKSLIKGETVQFVGWGTFDVQKRAARTGRNPQTGKEIKIAAKKVVKFKVGKPLVEGAKVVVEVLSQGKGPKVINFKYKPKKASHRKRGHRQLFTEVKVTSIIA